MADDVFAKEGAGVPCVDTFSIYDSTEPDVDDFDYFMEVERKRGRTGFHVNLGKYPVSFDIEYSEFVPTPGLGEREELKAARLEMPELQKYRIAFSGIGGDEMLGQSLDPRVQMADLLLKLQFTELAKLLTAWSLLIKRPWIQLFFQTLLLLLPMPMRTRMSPAAKVQPWINDKFARRQKISARLLDYREETWFWRPSIRDSFQTLMTLSGQLTYFRPSTMEKRYPYLDQTLVEFLTSIPSDQLLRPGERRSLMRRSLKDILPSEIISRQTKAGAGRCYIVTLGKHWNRLESALRSPLASRLGYLNQAAFHGALIDMRDGRLSPHFIRLLRALSLELWTRDAVTRGVVSIQDATPVRLEREFVRSRA
jgi:asparagine synthase (glutamine-hydrolysing)